MSILERIDSALLKEQDSKKDRKRSGKWSPSSFGRCYRFQYWKRKGEPESDPLEARTLRLFGMGKLVHDFVQGFFENDNIEVPVESDDVFGFADIVGEEIVTDIKSVHSKQFHRMYAKNYDIRKDKATNLLQVAAYALLLPKPRSKIRLVFVSKDDLCVYEAVFNTDEFKEEVDKELTTLRLYWEKGELPPAEPRAYGGRECRYCSMATKCKKMEKTHGSD